MTIPPFWGDVGMKKWSPFLVFGTRTQALLPKVHNLGYKKMVLWVPETKNGDHFFMSTSPQNGGKDICSLRLSLLSGF